MLQAKGENLYKYFLVAIFFTLLIPKAGDKVAGVPLTLSNGLFVLLFLLSIPLLIRNKLPRLDLAFLIYVCVALLPWLISGATVGSFARIVLPLFTPLFIYYWINPITQIVLTDRDRIIRLLEVIAVALILVCLYGLVQLAFGHYETIIPGVTMSLTDARDPQIFYLKANQIGEHYKVTSTYQNGNILGTALVMLTVPLLAACFYSRLIKHKLLFGLAATLCFVIVPLTMSRAALFGVMVSAAVFLVLQKNNKVRIAIALMGVLIFAVILSDPLLRNRMLKQFFDPTLNGRVAVVEYLVNEFKPTAASATFGLWYKTGRPELNDPAKNIFAYSSEIVYFTLALWTGIVGVALFLGISVKLLLKLLKTIRANPPNDFLTGISTGVLAAMIGYLMEAFIEGAFHLIPTGLIFWLLVGVGNALTHSSVMSDQASDVAENNKVILG
ncbi:MAG TPA: O-antigen ligase family protein [Bacillota bacterium]|nr:O-antigen ligase family protein [Bacillota bacterium]